MLCIYLICSSSIQVRSNQSELRDLIHIVEKELHDIVLTLLKNKDTKGHMLDWIGMFFRAKIA